MCRTEDLVRRHIDAFNAHDVDALLADFAPATEWVTGDYTVPAGQLREFFVSAMESITPQLSLLRIIDGGDVVAAEMTETWTHNGADRSASLIAVFDLTDGKIARAKIYREGSADA
ncbi:hypothetical protein KACC15558_18400 [Brevibacterium ammoniilyticum]|uniref:SnoaL-like domain-containing protein n=1 Tax=Brevibacterium ammoniilyticum TaxID=1046555 RepID=A0ABP9TZL0_9MICO